MGIREAVRALRNGDELSQLREVAIREGWQNALLTEDLTRLELAMEEEGWQRQGARMQREFTRDGLDRMISGSRAMYLSSPLIHRAVAVRTFYTWARGVTFQAKDDTVQEVIDQMTDNYGNRCELYSHQARILTDTDQQVDGNNFFALFTDDNGDVSVRGIPVDEMREIHLDADDPHKVMYYRRCWNQVTLTASGTEDIVQKEALYPDVRYRPNDQPGSIGNVEVRWDSPVIHLRTGGLKRMRFGMPETYAAMDWARAYRKFLEDWHTLVASLARFAWAKTSKGSKLRDKERLATTITPDAPVEQNPPPTAGSVYIGGAADELTPIPKTGAHTSAEDARPSRMMVGSAMDLPDTILAGDADVGNLATAKTLDRPTELAMISRQALWADFHKDIFYYALEKKAERGKLAARRDRATRQVELQVDADIAVTYPPILEHDQKSTVDSIVAAATLSGKTEAGTMPHRELSKLLMETVGVDDVEAALEQLDKEGRAELAHAVDALRTAMQTPEGEEEEEPPEEEPEY